MGAKIFPQDESSTIPEIFGPIYDENGKLVVGPSETTEFIEPVQEIIEKMKKEAEEAKKS